jgi:hypothetical protein
MNQCISPDSHDSLVPIHLRIMYQSRYGHVELPDIDTMGISAIRTPGMKIPMKVWKDDEVFEFPTLAQAAEFIGIRMDGLKKRVSALRKEGKNRGLAKGLLIEWS